MDVEHLPGVARALSINSAREAAKNLTVRQGWSSLCLNFMCAASICKMQGSHVIRTCVLNACLKSMNV